MAADQPPAPETASTQPERFISLTPVLTAHSSPLPVKPKSGNVFQRVNDRSPSAPVSPLNRKGGDIVASFFFPPLLLLLKGGNPWD